MPNFTINVFVSGSKSIGDYSAKFNQLGFSRKISASSGIDYILPEGVYNFNADISRQELLEKISKCFGGEYSEISVLITESRGRTWSNLKKSDV